MRPSAAGKAVRCRLAEGNSAIRVGFAVDGVGPRGGTGPVGGIRGSAWPGAGRRPAGAERSEGTGARTGRSGHASPDYSHRAAFLLWLSGGSSQARVNRAGAPRSRLRVHQGGHGVTVGSRLHLARLNTGHARRVVFEPRPLEAGSKIRIEGLDRLRMVALPDAAPRSVPGAAPTETTPCAPGATGDDGGSVRGAPRAAGWRPKKPVRAAAPGPRAGFLRHRKLREMGFRRAFAWHLSTGASMTRRSRKSNATTCGGFRCWLWAGPIRWPSGSTGRPRTAGSYAWSIACATTFRPSPATVRLLTSGDSRRNSASTMAPQGLARYPSGPERELRRSAVPGAGRVGLARALHTHANPLLGKRFCARPRFQNWVERRYGSIETLTRVWEKNLT